MTVIAATLAAPTGVLTALDRAAAASGMTHAQLLAKAGLVQVDWDAINTAISGISAANWFKLHNAVRLQTLVVTQTQPVLEGANGAVSSAPFGEQAATLYGNNLS